MVIAIIAGIVVGAVALVPFYFAARNAKKIDPTLGSFAMLGPFLLTIVISFAILVVGLVAGKVLAPEVVVPLAIAQFAAFVVGVVAFGIMLAHDRSKTGTNASHKDSASKDARNGNKSAATATRGKSKNN